MRRSTDRQAMRRRFTITDVVLHLMMAVFIGSVIALALVGLADLQLRNRTRDVETDENVACVWVKSGWRWARVTRRCHWTK